MDNNQYYFDAYFEFVRYADQKISEIEKKHTGNLSCGKGCCSCCEETSVLPIEFFSIVSAMKDRGLKIQPGSKSCAMLRRSLCQIYEFRPLICRTHGLPLAYGEDDDPLMKSISFCELNFKKKIPKFTKNNVLDMDELNLELVTLNENFIRSFDGELPERIELKNIVSYL